MIKTEKPNEDEAGNEAIATTNVIVPAPSFGDGAADSKSASIHNLYVIN
ncbi:hypothetical protein [Laceyella putida]|uniref:Uncharacterized protein n=1 Tax=Laceyella putida TaxID=110101 RepID=A0ABW2RQD8_9BACL